jgi:hypothetical protein
MTAPWSSWTAAGTPPSTRSSTPTARRTCSTPGSPPTTANYLGPWTQILQNAGGYTPEAAKAAALQVLPDILHYNRTRPATYPNGRVPTDDVYSLRFAWLTNGKVPPADLKPHDDLLARFP